VTGKAAGKAGPTPARKGNGPAAIAASPKPATAPTAVAAAKKPSTTTTAPAKASAISGALSAPRGGKADRLTLIKGIGPVNEKKLNENGIFHFDQIAAWTEADVAAVEVYLAFDGRIAREDWIGQAARLAQNAAAAPTTARREGE
jgi:branched-chain amino acid transport system ATP-binding protein